MCRWARPFLEPRSRLRLEIHSCIWPGPAGPTKHFFCHGRFNPVIIVVMCLIRGHNHCQQETNASTTTCSILVHPRSVTFVLSSIVLAPSPLFHPGSSSVTLFVLSHLCSSQQRNALSTLDQHVSAFPQCRCLLA